MIDLAIERALQLAQFANFKITRRDGHVTESDIPGEQVEDSLGGYTVRGVIVPVTVSYRDIEIDPLNPVSIEVDGEMVITNSRNPSVNFDAAELGALRKDWER